MEMCEDAAGQIFDIAIVSYNTDLYLHNLLASLGDVLTPRRFGEVHVWDNASADATPALLAALAAEAPWLRPHVSATNIHHGPALDRLLRHHCDTEWVLVLDPDTEVRRDFVPRLPPLSDPTPAFVGQIHPQMPQLYAYLAHLLIHRPTYLSLPPFRHDGAPGDELFRAVEMRGMPYARFRWSDFVAHAGQASLRAVHAGAETTNPFYAFAAREVDLSPASPERLAHESLLRSRLAAFLARQPRSRAIETRRPPDVADPPRVPTRGRSLHRTVSGRLRAMARAVRHPRTSRAIRRARRIGLVQEPEEVRRLLRLVDRLGPRRVLEIGTAYGGSLFLWTRAALPDACILSVDLPPWEPDDPWEARKVAQFRTFARGRQAVSLIRADSHDPASVDAVRAALGGDPLDFLFIDGDHSYEGARRDVADYGAFLRPGGILALHDIHPHSKGWGGEVPRLWRELRASHRSAELIADDGQDGFGIGVLWK